jgi:hypothetical protein
MADQLEDFAKGDRVIITDAFGREHHAVALTPVEGTHRDGKKIHDFPVLWITHTGTERVPWPIESVRHDTTSGVPDDFAWLDPAALTQEEPDE